MSSLPGEQNGHAVLKCCIYSNKWNMPSNYPGHWCQLYADCKGAILLSKQFAYTPTACVVGMVPGTCSILNHVWESVIWHRLIWAWTVLFFTKTFAMSDAWEDQWRWWVSWDFTWQPRYKALTQQPHLNLSRLFYNVGRPYVPWISVSILKTILVLSCLKLSKSQQNIGDKAFSLICKSCSVPSMLNCSQGSATAQPHRTTPAPILFRGGAHCVDLQLSHNLWNDWIP